MTRRSLAPLMAVAIVLVLAAGARADVSFDRAFGIGLDTGAEAFENCTTASGCQSFPPGMAWFGLAGSVLAPTAVTVDAEGRILVAEGGNHRVSRFVVAGDGTVSFDRAFGFGVRTGANAFENCTTASGCQSGIASAAAGGLNTPGALAVDAAGRILVGEDRRVSRFVVAGDGTVSFDRAFGRGVQTGAAAFENCTTATGCQAGSDDYIPGALKLPIGIAEDAEERLVVADGGGNAIISRFAVAGDGSVSFDRGFGFGVRTLSNTFENCTIATGCFSGSGSFDAGGTVAPTGVAIDAQGRILVSEQGGRRVSRFVVAGDGTVSFDRAFGFGVRTGAAVFENCTGATGCQAGADSTTAGALARPFGVALDRLQRIVTVDDTQRRVNRFVVAEDGSVAFDRGFGRGVQTGASAFENCTAASGCLGAGISVAAGGFFAPAAVAIDTEGRILVADVSSHRVHRLTFPMHRVTYDGNGHTGGSVPVDDIGYDNGDPVTVAANTGGLVRTGHTFAGWNTQADGAGTSYSPGDTFAMGTADVTLFARWTFTVSFDENGGSVVPNQIVPLGGTATAPIPPPTRVGHAFGGWFADPALTTPFDFATPITADRTLFARWTFVGQPDLAIVKTHATAFVLGQTGAYQVAVTNVGGAPTAGLVTVTDLLPAGLAASAIAGTGWTCVVATLTCTRADALGPGASYPTILVAVTVAVDPPPLVTNAATVAGGGDVEPANNTVLDPTVVLPGDLAGNPSLPWVSALIQAGITSGCSTTPRLYCPQAAVSRAQMAVFLLRGMLGADFQPPAPTGLFTDVPVTGNPATTHPLAAWIEELSRRGITSGCGPGIYCPASGVSRAHMAVFLVRAVRGADFEPPAPTGFFIDVPVTGNPATTHPLAAWIEESVGMIGPCGDDSHFCPDSTVTRGEMASFLVNAFDLPL